MNESKTHITENTQTMQTASGGVDFGVVQKEYHFSDETIHSLGELGRVLGRIRKRLISEGYTIKDGKCFKEVRKNDIINISNDVYEKCS